MKKKKYVHTDRKKKRYDFNLSDRIPFTDRQLQFIKLAQNRNTKVLFCSGPAGSAKTLLASYVALNMLREAKINEILYIRTVIESASKTLGYLPGELDQKFSPYAAPIHDKLKELLPDHVADGLIAEGIIKPIPVNFLRGCHFAEKFIFADEAQNMTKAELTTLLTRVGEFSKVIVAGDPQQSDINGGSGFKLLFNAFDNEVSRRNGIYTWEFGEDDIKRSEVVKYIVKVTSSL